MNPETELYVWVPSGEQMTLTRIGPLDLTPNQLDAMLKYYRKSTNQETGPRVWVQSDDHVVQVDPLKLTTDQLRVMLKRYHKKTGPGRPGRRVEVLDVDAKELGRHIGQEAAEQLAKTQPVFDSACALSRALGFLAGNRVGIAIKEAEGTPEWPELRGVSFRYFKE